MFALVFTIGTSFLLFVNGTNLLYSQSLVGRANKMQDRLSEQLLIGTLLTGSHVAFYVNNTGGLNANITAAFVLDTFGNVLKCEGKGLQSPCVNSTPPLPVVVNVGKGSTVMDTGYVYGSGTYTVELVTQRGGTFSATYPPTPAPFPVTYALSSGGIGDLDIQIASYKYYTVVLSGSTYKIQLQGGAFSIPHGVTSSNLAFSARFTNVNYSHKNMTLDAYSLLAHIQAPLAGQGGGTSRSYAWYVISNDSASNINPNYQQITLPYLIPVTVVFASQTPSAFTPYAPGISAGTIIFVSVLFHGCEGLRALSCVSSNDNYGQNIPYVSTLYY
jgi:hypothetical protein